MHIYKREFVESQGTQLVLPARTLAMCWRLGFPPEGKITRLLLRQAAGVASQLTVNLYDRNVCELLQYATSQSGSSLSEGQ